MINDSNNKQIQEKYYASIRRRDPSARSNFSIFFFPGVRALRIYKVARFFYKHRLRFLSDCLTRYARIHTGIEIHPGATIGRNLFIDHGFGVVIGETAVIGDNCTIYQGVTLGAKSTKVRGKRHPTLKNNVMVGANATILGNIVIGENSKIGAQSLIVKDVPDNMVTRASTITSIDPITNIDDSEAYTKYEGYYCNEDVDSRCLKAHDCPNCVKTYEDLNKEGKENND